MSTQVIVGAQWGDEGKGKIVDVLTERADWVVRYQGGNNAGHTVEVGDEKFVLHLVPSGILHASKKSVIGHGVVVDPAGLVAELDGLLERGIELEGRFFVSDRAHVVFPYHKALDAGAEKRAEDDGAAIGTTLRGIGPTYGDKVTRKGMRIGELMRADAAEELAARVADRNTVLEAMGAAALPVEETVAGVMAAAERLRPYVADTIMRLDEARRAGAGILFEGAQGTMLDIDYGSYPFVTSSSPTSGGAATGTGVPPNRIDSVVGVCKAYTTRVGEGPFPTELFDGDGQRLGEVGHEFGATTGRRRRCGWFDAVVARHAAVVNGVDEWAITKLDVLDGFERVRLATAYDCDGERVEHMPADTRRFARCAPVYEDMPGWMSDTTGIREYGDLPAAARAFLDRLEQVTGAPVGMVSVGPRREQILTR